MLDLARNLGDRINRIVNIRESVIDVRRESNAFEFPTTARTANAVL